VKIAVIRSLLLLFLFIATSNVRAQQSPERAVPDSVAEKMKKEKAFLYANDPNYWQKEEVRDDSAFIKKLDRIAKSPVLKWTLYILLGLVIVFIIYQVMVVNDFFIFSRSGKKKITGSDEEENYTADDLEMKIREAIANNHYRTAIRFMYLKTLRHLDERGLIQLHAKSTNREYIQQMDKHAQANEFRKLTRIYEFVWYGEFQPSASQFDIIRNHFKSFMQ
jgi:hypothetical protein